MNIKPVNIPSFRGLNTVGEATRTGVSWLGVADNVDVTQTGAIERRKGFTQVAAAAGAAGAFSTEKHDRAYVVAGGQLHQFDGQALQPLVILSGAGYPQWAEVNNDVYMHNGTDSIVIRENGRVLPWAWQAPGFVDLTKTAGRMPAGTYSVRCAHVLPDGRETGAGPHTTIHLTAEGGIRVGQIPQAPNCRARIYITQADGSAFMLATELQPGATEAVISAQADDFGVYLTTADMMPPPAQAEAIQHWQGRMYVATFSAADNVSVVWFSQPLQHHLFNYAADFFMVPGRVRMLAPVDEALIVGTDKGIHAYGGESITKLAGYGVIAGRPWARHEQRRNVLIWSERGLCEALPFRNVTERTASVSPGQFASASVIEDDGHTRLLTCITAGGTAFNQRNRSFP